jgi:hypothetical protein
MLDLAQVPSFLAKLPIRDRFSRRLVPFKLNYNQMVVHRKLEELQRKRQLMRIITVKARRVGVSSYADALGICQVFSRDGAKGLIVAHQFKSSKGLFEVPLNLINRHLPNCQSMAQMLAIPPCTQHLITVPHAHGESQLEISTAGSVEGGRGLGMSFLHMSEAAYYPSVESFVSLLPMVPRDLNSIIIIESTAYGRAGPGEHFYDYWSNAVEGRSEYVPVFLPWMDDPLCVADERKAYDAPIDDEERQLMARFKVTKAQLAWRRLTIETECKGLTSIFHQEYPSTAEEAFVSTGDPVFEDQELKYCEGTVQKPMMVGTVRRDVDGMRFLDNEFEHDVTGEYIKLHVWEMPVEKNWYYIGADAARGLRAPGEAVDADELGDFASVVVWNGSTGNQAARVAARINPEKLADWLDRLGRAYNNAMVSIELTGNLGLWAQSVLRDRYHYGNLYRWRNKDDKVRPTKAPVALGWETNLRTRPLMMDAFRSAIRERRIFVRDQALLQQMELCERSDDFRWQVKRSHDDILIAALVGWIALEQWSPPREIGFKNLLDDDITNQANIPMRYKDDLDQALIQHHAKITQNIKSKNRPDRLEGI